MLIGDLPVDTKIREVECSAFHFKLTNPGKMY